MPKCGECGALNHGSAAICVRCGAPTNRGSGEAAQSDRELGIFPQLQGHPVSENVGDNLAKAFAADVSPWNQVKGFNLDTFEADGSALSQLRSESACTDPSPTGEELIPGENNSGWGVVSTPPAEAFRPRFLRSPDLSGIVFKVENMPPEAPDFSVWVWMSRLLLFLGIVGFAALLIRHMQQRYGAIFFITAFLFLFLLSRLRFIGVVLLFSILGLRRILRPFFGNFERQIPVRMCRLLDERDQEHVLRIKGTIVRGAVDEGDFVYVWGRRRQGTWLFRRGYNVRARAYILLEGRYSWVTTLLLALLCAWLLVELSRIYPNWFG